MLWPRKLYLFICYILALLTPRLWQRWQSRVGSYLFYLLWGRVRQVLKSNLSVVLGRSPDDPEVSRLARKTFENYGLYLVDYVTINHLSVSNYKKTIAEEEGIEYIQEALDQGNGAILITPHLGNWELGGVTFALRGTPIHTLTLKDSEEKVQDYRDAMRGSLGIKTIHIDPDDHGTILKVARLLRANNVIAMLGDRWEGGKKAKVTFFDQHVEFPSGAMAMALATGAPVIPVFVTLRPDGRYRAWMEPPIRVERESGKNNDQVIAEKTQELATVFEKVIRCYPDQWYHFFDYWSRYRCENSSP